MLRGLLLLLLLVPSPVHARRAKHPPPAAAPAEAPLTDAECGRLAQHVLDLQVDELRRTDADFRALGGAEQLATVEQMRQDPELQQLAKGCGKDLSRADADCILKARFKSESEACVASSHPPSAGTTGPAKRPARRR